MPLHAGSVCGEVHIFLPKPLPCQQQPDNQWGWLVFCSCKWLLNDDILRTGAYLAHMGLGVLSVFPQKCKERQQIYLNSEILVEPTVWATHGIDRE